MGNSSAPPPSSATRSRFAWRSSSAPPRSPLSSTPPTLRSVSMWWSRCAQRHMLEPPPMFWDTQLLDHSLVPSLDPAGSVRLMLMQMLKLKLKLMPSSMEDSPLLTTLLPLQATLLEPLALLPQLLLLLAQLPLAMLLLLLLSATLLLLLLLLPLLLLLLHLLLLLTT